MFPGLPADKAGLLLGDEIVSADGAPFEPVGSFRNKAGKTVALKVRREANGPLIDVTVEPKQIEPGETFEAALKDSARIIEANGRRIGYVRVWSYAGNDYQRALEEVLSDGKLKDADALVWDLRDGWGGAQPRYLNVFNPYGPTMTLTGRDGEAHVVNYRWQQAGRAADQRRHAQRQGGARLRLQEERLRPGDRRAHAPARCSPRTAFLLSDGSLLILAVEDASVEGERLEGKGVEPDDRGAVRHPLCGRQGPAARQGDRGARRRRLSAGAAYVGTLRTFSAPAP